MTDNQEKLLAEFEVRIHDLMTYCNRFKEENQKLRSDLEEKDLKCSSLTQEVAALKLKCDNLLTAQVVSFDEKERKNARNRLSKMVREVDKCIALLNE